MTALRLRIIEDPKLAGYSERTHEAYVRAVRQLAEHSHRSPDRVSEDELRRYFVHIRDVKRSLGYQASGMEIVLPSTRSTMRSSSVHRTPRTASPA